MAGIIGKPYSQSTAKDGSAMHGPTVAAPGATLGHMPTKEPHPSMMHPGIKSVMGRGLHDPKMMGG